MIIDVHTHLSYDKGKKAFSEIKKELLLNMDKNGVEHAIIIPDNQKNSNCADLDTIARLIKDEPRLSTVGTLKVNEINKKNLLKIEELFSKKIIKGFKIFPGHDPVYPTDKRWMPVYKLCLRYNYPLIIHTGINPNDRKCAKYNDPKYITKIARSFPKLKIIIAHYFWPKLDYCFKTTNGFENIYFDTSALADPEVIKASGGIKKVQKILTKTIKRRDASVIFGTDWPMCNIEKHIDLINLLSITGEERKKVFYKNARKIFKLFE